MSERRAIKKVIPLISSNFVELARAGVRLARKELGQSGKENMRYDDLVFLMGLCAGFSRRFTLINRWEQDGRFHQELLSDILSRFLRASNDEVEQVRKWQDFRQEGAQSPMAFKKGINSGERTADKFIDEGKLSTVTEEVWRNWPSRQ